MFRGVFICLNILSFTASAIPLSGTVYEKDTNRKNALYWWQRIEEGDASALKIKLVYTGLDNQEAVIENVLLENGKIKKYSIEHKQTNESGWLEVRDNKIFFEYTKEGKTKTSDEKLTENLVVTATVADFLAQNTETLMRGDTVSARLGVLDRRETVGFKFFKTGEGTLVGRETVTIKMKPTSFIIAAIVDPLLFTFDKNGMKILEISGRTMPKQLISGKWKDLDANTVYHWN